MIRFSFKAGLLLALSLAAQTCYATIANTVLQVPTVAALQAIGVAAPQYPVIEVVNYNSNGSSKFFSYQASCPTDVYGIIQVVPTGLTGCYVETPAGLPSANLNIASLEGGSLGSELTSASGVTSTGWTGSYAGGFTHTTGNTSALSFTIPGIAAGSTTSLPPTQLYYTCVLPTGATAGSVTPTLGGSPASIGPAGTAVITPALNGSLFCWGNQAVSTAGLIFTPTSNYDGKLASFSVKADLGFKGSQTVYDSTGGIAYENRFVLGSILTQSCGAYAGWGMVVDPTQPDNSAANTLCGAAAGKSLISGTHDTLIGAAAGGDLTNQNYVTAIGGGADRHGIGSNDVIIGDQSFYDGSGGNNASVGHFNANGCLSSCVDNALLGSGIATVATAIQHYSAIGLAALDNCTTCHDGVAIGYLADQYNTSGFGGVVIGSNAGVSSSTPSLSGYIAIGSSATVTASNQLLITTGTSNIQMAAGIPSGTCALGSLYLNQTPSASTDIMYVCGGDGAWHLVL